MAVGGIAFVLAAATAGCGSSKPAYCSDLSSLKTSVSDLPSAGVDNLSSQISTIKSDAAAVVRSARSDFPSESGAIRASVDALTTAVEATPSNPSPAQVAAIARDATAVVSAVNGFSDAASSSCD